MTSAMNDLARLILAQLRQDEAGRKTQDLVDDCMKGAIADVRRSRVNALNPVAPVTPLGAQKVEAAQPLAPGWQHERPLPYLEKGSHMDQIVDGMVQKFAGPPVGGSSK